MAAGAAARPKRHRRCYRYGFGGHEADHELKGAGNSYTTMFRQYDPRLGRWLSTDPVTHSWQSPYVGYDNNPVLFADPSGADVIDDVGDFFNDVGDFLFGSESTPLEPGNEGIFSKIGNFFGDVFRGGENTPQTSPNEGANGQSISGEIGDNFREHSLPGGGTLSFPPNVLVNTFREDQPLISGTNVQKDARRGDVSSFSITGTDEHGDPIFLTYYANFDLNTGAFAGFVDPYGRPYVFDAVSYEELLNPDQYAVQKAILWKLKGPLLILGGAPLIEKSRHLGGATQRTSAFSILFRRIQWTFPRNISVPTPVLSGGRIVMRSTRSIGGAAARWLPAVGWVALGYDVYVTLDAWGEQSRRNEWVEQVIFDGDVRQMYTARHYFLKHGGKRPFTD